MPINYPEGRMGALIAEGIKLCTASLSGFLDHEWHDCLPGSLSP